MGEAIDAPAAVFVLCDRESPAAGGVRAYLAACGPQDARWFDVRDVNDLERAAGLVAGPIVVVTSFEDLAALLWDGALDRHFWQSPRVRVEFVPTLTTCVAPAGAATSDNSATAAFRALILAWEVHRLGRRRERTVAGVCLSAVAIAAAFVLVLLSR
jgi:hypothetical protein